MGQLMDDDAGFKVAIAIWVRSVPKVHPAPSVLPVRRGHEIRVIEPRTILGICDNGITLLAASSEVVLLEVAGHLVKAVARLPVRSPGR
jgi:hypothetical protein